MSSPWNRKYFSSLVLGHSLLFIAIIIMVELTVVVDVGFLKGILHSMESKLRPLITKLVYFMFHLPLPTYLPEYFKAQRSKLFINLDLLYDVFNA